MKRFILGFILAISIPVMAAVLWPSGAYLETFQNGFIFGSGKILSVLNDVITFDSKRLDDRPKDVFFQEDFEGASVSFTCGTNLTAADETVDEIDGTSKSFTQGATPPTVGVKCEGPTITLAAKEQTKNLIEVCFNAKWNGNNNDMAFQVYGNTSTSVLVEIPIPASTTAKKHCGYFSTDGEASIDYDISVLAQSANSELIIDDIEFASDPLSPTNIFASSEWTDYSPDITGIGSDTLLHSKWKRVGDTVFISLKVQTGTVAASDFTIPLPNGYTIKGTDTTEVLRFGHIERESVASDETLSVIGVGGDNFLQAGRRLDPSANNSFTEGLDGNVLFGSSSKFSVEAIVPVNELSNTSQGVVVKNRTDSASVENVFSAEVDGSGNVTKENVDWIDGNCTTTSPYTCTLKAGLFSEAPNCVLKPTTTGRCATQNTASTSSQFDARITICSSGSLSNSGFEVVCQRQGTDYIKETDKVYTTAVDSLTGSYLRATGNAGTSITANTTNIDFANEVEDTSGSWNGTVFTAPKYGFYEVHGVVDITSNSSFYIYAYINGVQSIPLGTGPASAEKKFDGVVKLNEGDTLSFRSDQGVTLNNSTIHSITIKGNYGDRSLFVGTFGQPTCYVKDVKATTVAAGSSTTTTWNNRDLNTTEGDCSFLSLASNDFTLEAGSYNIECHAPIYKSNIHKLKLRQDPTGTPSDLIIGLSAYNSTTTDVQTNSILNGRININASETFDLQQYTASGQAGNGLGVPTNDGTNEVYTQCKITKVR
jgi:hypothetical protein